MTFILNKELIDEIQLMCFVMFTTVDRNDRDRDSERSSVALNYPVGSALDTNIKH